MKGKKGLRVGYAISDCVHKDLAESLESLGKTDVVELQLDDFIWDLDTARNSLDKIGFISVHVASKDQDLSADESHIKHSTILNTIKSMDFAHEAGADSLVIHPINNMYLDPGQRLQRKRNFLKVFKDNLIPHYQDNGHEYIICLENIEYPKYPATLEESLMLHREASTYHQVGMAIDVPHVWNTRRILREDPARYIDWTAGYPDDRENLADYISGFIERNKDKIVLYHIAGFSEKPGKNPVTTHGPLYGEFINDEYRILMELLKDKPIVMEIHDEDYEVMKLSKESMEGLR
ncbi:MAG: sugar phosphate isomerase/epimerase family protein [Candidatus Woesearchaeota archaeon]